MLSQVTNWSLKKKFGLIVAIIFLPASLTFSFLNYHQEYLARVEEETARARLVAQSLSEHCNDIAENRGKEKKGGEEGRGKENVIGSSGESAENYCLGLRSGLVKRVLGENLSFAIRYVSLTPLNPKNRADSFEQKGIRLLKQKRGQAEYVKLTWIQGERAIRYLKPIRSSPSCLKCHAAAPAQGMGKTAITSPTKVHSQAVNPLNREGNIQDKTIQGAISITVPARSLGIPLEKSMERTFLLNLGLIGSMVLIWLIFAKIHISDRLGKLSKGMIAVIREEEDPEEEIKDTRNDEINDTRNADEIGSLFSIFYLMRSVLRKKMRLLRNEIAMYRSLTHSVLYGMVVMDIEGKILLFNEGAERIFGWKRGEILNQKATLLIPPKLRWKYKYSFIQRLRDERLRKEPIETIGLRKSGEEFFVRLSISIDKTVLAGKGGQSMIFSAVIQDITEQKRKEGEITRQNEKLALLNQISTELLLERDLKKLAERSLDESLELTDSPFGLFLLKNKDGDLVPLAMLGLSAQRGGDEEIPPVFRPVGILGEIVRQQKPHIINTNSRSTWTTGKGGRTVLSFGKFSFYSFLGVPIISDQEVIGVICAANRPEGYTSKEQEFLTSLANDLSLLIVRNAAEKETQILKEEFQTLFEQSSDMIAICNLEGRIIAVNYRVVQYTGYAYQELINYSFWKLHLPDEERSCKEFLKKVLKNEASRLESFFRQKNGGSFPVDLHANIVAFRDQKLVQVVIRDTIQFKKAESDFKGQIGNLMKKLEEFRWETTFFRIVVDTLSEYVILTDRTGRILLANAPFCQRFGYTPDELVGQPVEFLFSPDLSVDIVDQIITQAMEEGWNGGVVHLTKEGEKIQLNLSMQAVHDPENGIFGLMGIYSECMS